jgi:hypothetical protein
VLDLSPTLGCNGVEKPTDPSHLPTFSHPGASLKNLLRIPAGCPCQSVLQNVLTASAPDLRLFRSNHGSLDATDRSLS